MGRGTRTNLDRGSGDGVHVRRGDSEHDSDEDDYFGSEGEVHGDNDYAGSGEDLRVLQ